MNKNFKKGDKVVQVDFSGNVVRDVQVVSRNGVYYSVKPLEGDKRVVVLHKDFVASC